MDRMMVLMLGLATAAAFGPAGTRLIRRFSPIPEKAAVAAAGLALAAAGLTAWAWRTVPLDWRFAATLLLGFVLLLLALIDLVSLRLPDALTLPLTAAGLGLALLLPHRPWIDHAIGAALGYAMLAGVGWLYRRWRGRDGLGLGDAKLMMAGGAWLGWPALPSVLLLACLGGFALFALGALRQGGAALRSRMPFGVPLAMAIWLVWLYGPLDIA